MAHVTTEAVQLKYDVKYQHSDRLTIGTLLYYNNLRSAVSITHRPTSMSDALLKAPWTAPHNIET